ncbi:hypothetical protein R3P38DRAFT_2838772 [Favolaschia claudopus]|uniref:MYND-type domain-containing protein n=1 Tax=Favolaschia claudopus TaxID=2862362 RepID=A0AAW0E7X3_9AGAR
MDSLSSLASLAPEQFFGGVTKAGKALAAAEKKGNVPKTKNFDFSVQETCCVCQKNITPPLKVLRCSACRAPIYCGRECATKHWKYPPPQPPGSIPGPTHKELCPANKRHMERREYYDGSDATFSFDIARGRFGVFGGTGTGYWSHRGGPIPHSNRGVMESMLASSPYGATIMKAFAAFDHTDGTDLLGARHLTDVQGWKLEPAFIPYLDFLSTDKRPALVTSALNSWDEWYQWRKLPKESPAALLMSFPMTVYRLLVHCLEVTGPTQASADKRRALSVHLLGAEVELNYLPLFAELALLLPYHDIQLVVFGSGAETLIKAAKKKPSSLVAKSSLTTPVYDYTAPKECGASKIAIHIYGDSPSWSPSATTRPPDALVACNAGIFSYREWEPVVQEAHRRDIPFAVTEYAEQSAEHTSNNLGMLAARGGGRPRKAEEYTIETNPFHRPGQRPIPLYRLPNLVNGFTIVVVKTSSTPLTTMSELASSIADLD